MENLWDDGEIGEQASALELCAYASRLLGREKTLVLPRSGSASVKVSTMDILGEVEDILWVSAEGRDLRTIKADGFTPLRKAPIMALANLEDLPEAQFYNALYCSRAVADAPLPPKEAVIHAILRGRYVFFTRPEALLVITQTAGWKERLHNIYHKALLIVEGVALDVSLAKAISSAIHSHDNVQIEGILVPGQGLFTFGEDAREVYSQTIRLVTIAEQTLQEKQAWNITSNLLPVPERAFRQELATLRKTASDLAGFPVLLHRCQALPDLEFYPGEGSPDVYKPGEKELDVAPRVILDPELGLLTVGRRAEEAQRVAEVYLQTIRVQVRALALGGYQPQTPRFSLGMGGARRGQPQEKTAEKEEMFSGEIALVTGGASGIGKACVDALLRRGAAVATIDVNPRVKTLYERPNYLGLEADLTDEAAVIQGFEMLVRTFGGLDMLVLNAGIFPPGIRIESLEMATWQKVMRINLDSYLTVMREAYPLLKASPKGGRVVLNASKNVLAPGAGAAAYSASKAAVTQLARVAVLEWAKDHIRVNMIHPDAIYDTGIWTEEVLNARASFYGMSVQKYKTRNLLGVELDSHYVGELVAEMLGPLFEKITGAQIPVDGGSDRVI